MGGTELIDLEKDPPKLLCEIFKLSNNYQDSKNKPTELRSRLDFISSYTMTLWIAVIQKQEWGAVSAEEILHYAENLQKKKKEPKKKKTYDTKKIIMQLEEWSKLTGPEAEFARELLKD